MASSPEMQLVLTPEEGDTFKKFDLLAAGYAQGMKAAKEIFIQHILEARKKGNSNDPNQQPGNAQRTAGAEDANATPSTRPNGST